MKKPVNPKERNLLKGAIRRVFSRSDLRNQALSKHDIVHVDPLRPRVTKWSFCGECGVITPKYVMQVDHTIPVIATTETLNDLTWDQLIEERVWCDLDNLMPLCPDCHKAKSKIENKERREIKKARGVK